MVIRMMKRKDVEKIVKQLEENILNGKEFSLIMSNGLDIYQFDVHESIRLRMVLDFIINFKYDKDGSQLKDYGIEEAQ